MNQAKILVLLSVTPLSFHLRAPDTGNLRLLAPAALNSNAISRQPAVEDAVTFGQKILLNACKTGNRAEAERMIQLGINPTFPDPETGLTPFLIALQTKRTLAAYLLGNGAKPYAHLQGTRTIYSESFERGDTEAVRFLALKKISYLPTTQKRNAVPYMKEDLTRLIVAGRLTPLRQALAWGLIAPEAVTLDAIALAQRHNKEQNDAHPYDPKITTLLRAVFKRPCETVKVLREKVTLR